MGLVKLFGTFMVKLCKGLQELRRMSELELVSQVAETCSEKLAMLITIVGILTSFKLGTSQEKSICSGG